MKGNNITCFKTLLIVLAILTLYETSYSNTLKVTRYFNELTDFTCIFDSPSYGLVISNSTGTYFLDTESGKCSLMEGSNSNILSGATVIFEFEGILYLNDKWNRFYKYDGVFSREISSGLKSYLIFDEKLYMLFDHEPRIRVQKGEQQINSNLGETNDASLAILKEFNGEVYGFFSLNWSGNYYFFQFTDNKPSYKIHPSLNNFQVRGRYDMVNDFVVIKDEILFSSYQRLFKFSSLGLNEDFNENYTFATKWNRSIELFENIIIGYTPNAIYSYNLNTNEEKILLEYEKSSYYHTKINDTVFYLIDNTIYKLNKDKMEVEFVLEGEYNTRSFSSSDNGLFVAYSDRLIWYYGNQKKTYGGEGLYSNHLHSLAYDKKNDKIVAVGNSVNKYFFQYYDNNQWQHNFLPDSVLKSYQNDKVNLEIDYEGRYFFTFWNVLAVKEGEYWTKHSLLFDPDSENQSERYHALCTDSTGNVLINANMTQVYSDGKRKQENTIWKYENGKFNYVLTSSPDRASGRVRNAICLTNGEVFIDASDDYLIKYFNNSFSLIRVSDGLDNPFTNGSRRMGFTAQNELALTFNHVTGWKSGHGSYAFNASISLFTREEKWDHNSLKLIAINYFQNLSNLRVFTDRYNNTWLISDNKWLRFNDNNTFSIFTPELSESITSPELTQSIFRPVDNKMIYYKNDLWFATDGGGIFRIEMPDPATSVFEKAKSDVKVILSTENNSNLLRLMDSYEKYTICGISASPILTGGFNNIIDVSSLANGVYFIVIEDGSKYIFEKFVILR